MSEPHKTKPRTLGPSINQDDFKAAARGTPSSQAQIDQLNAIRINTQPAPGFNPPGMDMLAIQQRHAERVIRNRDQEIAFQKRRLARFKSKAKDDFNKDNDKDRGDMER